MLWVHIMWVPTEAILMSTNNIGFHEDMAKIIFQLSNMHLICFSDKVYVCYSFSFVLYSFLLFKFMYEFGIIPSYW